MSQPRRRSNQMLHILLWMVAGGTLLLLLAGGLFLWALGGFKTQRPLDEQVWRHPQHTDMSNHDREAMVRDVQRWLEREQPTREQVRARLGRGDADSTPQVDSYLVGCGFTSGVCMDMEALQVHYDTAGHFQKTDFHQY